jgi:hypothetical protein
MPVFCSAQPHRPITPQLAQEIGSQFSTRIEGTCIKHHRKVEHRNRPPDRGLAPVKKSIYSLIDLGEGTLTAYGALVRFAAQFSLPATSVISPTCPRSTTSPPGCALSTE